MPALLSALQPIVFAGSLMLASALASAAAAAVATSRDENACKTDERVALDKLKQDWGQYNDTQRGHCVRLSSLGGAPSYVELLTCLELAKAANELPDEGLNRGMIKR